MEVVKFREKENWRKMVEEFSNMVLTQCSSLLQPLSIELEAPTVLQVSKKEREDQRKRLQLAKLEAGLRMRDFYTQHQRRWEEFRNAERQRRAEKAKQKELGRLAGILSDSVARRHYCQEKFLYTAVVRSHHHAATTIQRAYRQYRQRKQLQRKKLEEKRRRALWCKNRAARVIQRAWRRHRSWKAYVARNFKFIKTSPVINNGPHPLDPPTYWRKPYERGTIVSG